MRDAHEAMLVAAVDALLPQTQCTRCGYSGCLPYARAIVENGAPLNRCPPGGTRTIAALAALVGRAPLPLDPSCGTESAPRVARIDEERCIGCARCLPPCPVDAIVGAPRYTHTVLESVCTGCELCIAPCPVDCIAMIPRPASAAPEPGPARNRERHRAHEQRAAQRTAERAARIAERKRNPAT